MKTPDFDRDRAQLDHLLATGLLDDADAFVRSMHVTYHDRPIEHVRVHVAWMRVHAARGSYLRVVGHAFAGFVVAAPASLVQRYTGLVVPAFDAEHGS